MGSFVAAEERRSHFIEAAKKVIQEEGMQRATTRRIAERAGSPPSHLHHLFRDKETLLREVYAAKRVSGTALLEKRILPGSGAKKAMSQIMKLLAEIAMESPSAHLGELEFNLWCGRGPERQVLVRENFEGWVDIIGRALTQAALEGEQDVDVSALARTMVMMLDGATLQWIVTGATEFEDQLEQLIRTLRGAWDAGAFDRTLPPQ